jgi:hypothetical protein
MSVRMDKAWVDMTEENVVRLPGCTGVYQIADADGNILDIGYAGGRSLFGLRSALADQLAALGAGRKFRYEVTAQYMSRFHELVNIAFTDNGELPALLARRGVRATGRIKPS